jgi:hypothetical protein
MPKLQERLQIDKVVKKARNCDVKGKCVFRFGISVSELTKKLFIDYVAMVYLT